MLNTKHLEAKKELKNLRALFRLADWEDVNFLKRDTLQLEGVELKYKCSKACRRTT